ncbi:hypothetical protein DMN91_010202 [Ooceraea biroi]|uniref:THAP-type domain-containing protein n=1 Tax=Ooceraea biroi TaxID=2015173 RepID=A0A3L8DCA3_OOCBI|nr:hypothetical protein DMN91_010202 [Ooceraea biroi]
MSKLWIKACNRTINRTAEELYKNYRIYSVHFNENMYLNDIKSRLLPRAIPNAITPNVMANSDTCIIPQGNEMLMTECNTSKEEIDIVQVVSKEVQMPQTLSHDTPRKNKLKGRIISLQRENRKLKEQLKNSLKKSKIKENLEYYGQLTNKFLSPSIAALVKEQAKLSAQSIKE